VVVLLVVVVELLVVELVLVEELVDVLVLVDVLLDVLVDLVVEVVVVPQSWKQQEHEVETTPPICVQADALLTVAHCGGFANWQVTPALPQDVAASQLSSSDLHADVIVRSFWAMQLWNFPLLLPVQLPPVQHCNWTVLFREHRCDRQASVSPANASSGEIVSQEHT
jgi:hypothetical protein